MNDMAYGGETPPTLEEGTTGLIISALVAALLRDSSYLQQLSVEFVKYPEIKLLGWNHFSAFHEK